MPRANGAQLAAGSKARELKDTFVFSNNSSANNLNNLHFAPPSMRDPDSDSRESHNKQQTSAQPHRFGILEFENNDDVKRMAVKWKTELASASSSMLSSFIAVGTVA